MPKSQLFRLDSNYRLVLASTSPRRSSLLQASGLPFTCVSAEIMEPLPVAAEKPASFAQRCAQAKGLDALKRLDYSPVILLAADTIVALDDEIMGKPESEAHALGMLLKLSGRTHQVYTAVFLAVKVGRQLEKHQLLVKSDVSFASWPEEVLASYARSEEPRDKAGAYAVQGNGAFLVESINGSWTNVVGLPMTELLQKLLALGLVFPAA